MIATTDNIFLPSRILVRRSNSIGKLKKRLRVTANLRRVKRKVMFQTMFQNFIEQNRPIVSNTNLVKKQIKGENDISNSRKLNNIVASINIFSMPMINMVGEYITKTTDYHTKCVPLEVNVTDLYIKPNDLLNLYPDSIKHCKFLKQITIANKNGPNVQEPLVDIGDGLNVCKKIFEYDEKNNNIFNMLESLQYIKIIGNNQTTYHLAKQEQNDEGKYVSIEEKRLISLTSFDVEEKIYFMDGYLKYLQNDVIHDLDLDTEIRNNDASNNNNDDSNNNNNETNIPKYQDMIIDTTHYTSDVSQKDDDDDDDDDDDSDDDSDDSDDSDHDNAQCITLISTQNKHAHEKYSINKKYLLNCTFIRDILAINPTVKSIFFANIPGYTLDSFINYLEYRKEEYIEGNYINRIQMPLLSNNIEALVDPVLANMINVLSTKHLYQLLITAEILDCKSLVCLICAKIGTMIKGKSPKEMLKILADY